MAKFVLVSCGETLPEAELNLALEHARCCDPLPSVGTSGLEYPAARIPGLAQEHGAHVIHINTEPSDALNAFTLQGRASELLAGLFAAISSCSD